MYTPDLDLQSEMLQEEVRLEVVGWSELESYSEKWSEKRALIQQKFGDKALSTVLELVVGGRMQPYYAIGIAGGMEPTAEIYKFSKELAMLPLAYTDSDHSAIDTALELLFDLSDHGEFLNDIEVLQDIYNKEVLNQGDLSRLNSTITSLRNQYIEGSGRNFFEYERNKSREIFNLGMDGFYGKNRSQSEYDGLGYGEDYLDPEGDGDTMSHFLALIRMMKVAEIESGSKDYILFKNEQRREEFVEIGRRVCEFLKVNEIKKVIFVDRSARPGYITVLENWKIMYPHEELPEIYFMNPKGFRSIEDVQMDFDVLVNDKFNALAKNDLDEPPLVRSEDEIEKDLKNTYKRLFENEDRKVLLFDNCIHSGDSVRPMLKSLTKSGLDVSLGLVSQNVEGEPMKADLIVLDHTPDGACYPFDKDQLVEKTYTSVHSLPSLDPEKRILSKQIRREIKRAVQEYYDAKP
jgi:hypothetical protein